MQGRWDDKSDDEIKKAYMWSTDSFNMWSRFNKPHSETVLNAIKTSREKLDNYILPRMEKRNLFVAPPISRYGYLHGGQI
jgi:hypothetical protein